MTGEEVLSENIVKAYQFEKNSYVQIEPDEIDALKLDTNHTVARSSLRARSTSCTTTNPRSSGIPQGILRCAGIEVGKRACSQKFHSTDKSLVSGLADILSALAYVELRLSGRSP